MDKLPSSFRKRETRSFKQSASSLFKKERNNINIHRVFMLIIIVTIIFTIISILIGLTGRTYMLDGHQYKRLTPYNHVHDPDCPCFYGE